MKAIANNLYHYHRVSYLHIEAIHKLTSKHSHEFVLWTILYRYTVLDEIPFLHGGYTGMDYCPQYIIGILLTKLCTD